MKKLFSLITVLGLLWGGNGYAEEIKLTCMSDDKSSIIKISLFPQLKAGSLSCFSCNGWHTTSLRISDDNYDLYWTIVSPNYTGRFTINRTTARYQDLRVEATKGTHTISYGMCSISKPKF